jgi:hypothetical protein
VPPVDLAIFDAAIKYQLPTFTTFLVFSQVLTTFLPNLIDVLVVYGHLFESHMHIGGRFCLDAGCQASIFYMLGGKLVIDLK